jgi:hypothetical protein
MMHKVIGTPQINALWVLAVAFMADTKGQIVVTSKRKNFFPQT